MRSNVKSESAVRGRPSGLECAENDNDFDRRLMCDNVSKPILVVDYAPPDAILCGHNIAFDAAFLKAAYTSAGIRFPFDYHLLDVWSVSFFLLETQRIKLNPHNLTALCNLYGIPRGHKHDALEDVHATALILSRMFDAVRLSTGRVPE